VDATTPYRPAGTLNVATALQPYTGPWDRRTAAHLLRRAGFGGSPGDITRLAAVSMNAAVDGFVRFPEVAGLGDRPVDMPDPQDYLSVEREIALATKNGDADNAKQLRMDLAKSVQRSNLVMQQWWLQRMLASPAPLQEKMTLFWHGHFTSELGVKGTSPDEALAQNNLFRQYALGNIHDLTQAVSTDPAMLRYLDNARNDRAHPNENYARELMELFTLGIGNYTEQDIRESARAFTGWTVRANAFYDNPRQHDDGSKTFLGRTGDFDGRDIVDIIFAQPAAPRWFASKLLNFFVYNQPEPALVDGVATLLRRHSFDLQPVMSTLLRSNVFYSPRAYRALVKSPVEFVVGTYRLFGVPSVDDSALAALRRMGQILFHPPSVKGWDDGIAWLNSGTLITRENFASALMVSPMTQEGSWLTASGPRSAREAAQAVVDGVLQGDLAPAGVERIVAYLNGAGTSANGTFSGENFEERIRGAAYLAMATPAYQLN
jgi:uncharacterized protein (DUF1800 family)